MNKWAINDGYWSDSNTWNDGTLPAQADDVYCNGHCITANQHIHVNFISNAQILDNAGGKLMIQQETMVQSTIFAHCNPIIEFSGTGNLTIIGFITGGDCGEFSSILNTNTGTIAVSGVVRGGNGGYTHAINNVESGTISVTGFVGMGWGGYSYGIFNSKNGTININNVVSNLSGFYGKEKWEENI